MGFRMLIVLQEGKVTVFGRDASDAAWAEMTSMEVPAGMRATLGRRLGPGPPQVTVITECGSAGANAPAGNAKFDRVLTESATCFDADPDLIVFGESGVQVFQNLSEVGNASPMLVPVPNEDSGSLTGVTTGLFVDVEHDGDLDLVLSSARD